tara:strand:+ start:857 stop:1783 length:927 start_codon:yes stop_codon:yes gene_type:complete
VSEPIELLVPAEAAGERVDRFLADHGVATRSTLKRWIDEGRVTIDGNLAAPKHKVRSGGRVVVRPAPPPTSEAIPQDIPLDIRFQDEHLLVVHKPAGLVVHPAPGHPDGTLVNALLHHVDFRDPSGDPLRPGIVHRLDKDTSGTMVVAKTAAAREGLVGLFQAHDIERRYDAIALGDVTGRTFDTLHGRHPVHRKRFSSQVPRGKRAVTHVRAVAALPGATHVQCTLETGRTHQIRVHLADAGHALLADELYGKRPKDLRLRQAHDAIGRQALHAGLLGFVHPITGEAVRVEAEPPEDFRAALAVLTG